MNPLRLLGWLGLLLVSCGSIRAESPALSEAAGFGVGTPAGRGGRIIKVTTLAREGPGSLQAAIEASEPRIVVFEVGGVIDLGGETLRVQSPYLTIAGQTAPSPGITLIRGGLVVRNTHDVRIQHLAVRPGDNGRGKGSGWDTDGIAVYASRNVVIDHCSATWAVDENLSVSGPRLDGATSSDVTLSHCLIAEGLDDSSHAKGPHSKGTLIHDRIQRVAILGCLYASNVDRNPYFKIGSLGVVANNVIYNPGKNAITSGWQPDEWAGHEPPPEPELTIVGNILIHGPDTPDDLKFLGVKVGRFHLQSNRQVLRDGGHDEPQVDASRLRREPTVWIDGLRVLKPEETLAQVLETVGARPFDRDPIDQRIIDGVRRGGGRIIDSQTDVGGYPQRPETRRALLVPAEGIEAWLASFASGGR